MTAMGKTCTACGAERKPRNLRYDSSTFFPYCLHAHLCNDKHPNTTQNLIQRGSELLLLPYAQVEKAYREHLLLQHANPETAETLTRLVTQPLSVRFNDPTIAAFIVNIQQEYKVDSLAETIRMIVQWQCEQHGKYGAKSDAAVQAHVNNQTAAQTVQMFAPPPVAGDARIQGSSPAMVFPPQQPQTLSQSGASPQQQNGSFGRF